jgi:hypothetical protein
MEERAYMRTQIDVVRDGGGSLIETAASPSKMWLEAQ